MSNHQYLILVLGLAALPGSLCQAADLPEIIRRGTLAIESDWAADPDYAYIEKDEALKNGVMTSKTSQVVYMAGSDYYLPLATDDKPLSPEAEDSELVKLKAEWERRNSESTEARRSRIDKYKKDRDENGALLLDFPSAFNFALKEEGEMYGHPAYVLAAMPKQRSGPLSRAAKVLSGMQGIDKDGFHVIRASCDVVHPVPIYGILARVLPGTHVEFEMNPVSDSAWLITSLAMTLKVSKFFWFTSTQVTHTTYSGYRLNQAVLDELLARANSLHP